MDLLVKVLLVIIIVIAVSALVFVISQHTTPQSNLTSSEAVALVLKDLKQNNPNAIYSIINVSNSTSKAGSYYIVLSVVYNASKPCPTLLMEAYDYPAFGLSAIPLNDFISNCTVTTFSSAPSNISSSPELAIVRSYSANNTMIRNYVNTFGYKNTNVYAKFYPYLNQNSTNLGQSFYNVWLVHYVASNSKYSIYAVLDSSGSIAGNYTSNSTT